MIVGPIIGAFSFAAIASARPTLVGPADLTWLYIVAFIGMVITVLSLPMVIVGRRYIIDSEKP
jgi:hypothetical protein